MGFDPDTGELARWVPDAREVAPVNPEDPARLGYPPTLPIEVALRTASIRDTCIAYGLSSEEWDRIRFDPIFLADLQRAVEMVKKDGMSFKLKAKLQAEELLKTSWRLIHDVDAPHAVRSQLIQATMRWAEYDGAGKDAGVGANANFNIQINLGG